VAIVDVRLPPTHTDEGLRAALEARKQVPGLPILVLSAHVEQLYARELLADQAGGVGYLLKDRVFTDEQFTDALRTVARGGTVMDPEVIAKLLARRSRQMPGTRLTDREREVLALMAEGRSNSAIAHLLFVSEKAVTKHSTSIFAKLGLPPSEDDNPPSSRPSLDSPAIASTRASTSPSASLRSRVSTLPRIGTICSWRPVARSRAARRGDPVPIRAPGGSASRLVPPGQISASRGSSRAGNAATCNPGTGAVGRSLPEWTTRSTVPRAR